MTHMYWTRFVALAGLIAIIAALVPVLAYSASEELAIENAEVTTSWASLQGEGFRVRLPSGWSVTHPDQHIGGTYEVLLSAPACAADEPDCTTKDTVPLMLAFSVERAENPATPPGDEALMLLPKLGYHQRDVLVRGQAALLFTPDTTTQMSEAVLVFERDQVFYHIALSADFLQSNKELLGLLLGTLEFQTDQAPAAFTPQPDASDVPAAPQPDEPSAGAPQASVVYDRAKAVAEALAYGGRSTNRDGCYIFTNGRCNTGETGADGAHFVDCVLKAAGLPTAKCEGTRSHVGVAELYNVIRPDSDIVPAAQAIPGDILIIRENGEFCWSAVVVDTSNGIWVAAHSVTNIPPRDRARVAANSLWCSDPPIPVTRSYLRIRSDSQIPTVQFTAPTPGRFAYGATLPLRWQGDDGSGGTGIRSYTVQQSVEGGDPSDILRDLADTGRDLPVTLACRVLTFSVTATDNAGNTSLPAQLVLSTGLPGDRLADGTIDTADLAAVDAAWGTLTGQPGYNATLDTNADGRIDVADTLWMRRHIGDRCP